MRVVAAIIVPWIVWGLLDNVVWLGMLYMSPDSFGLNNEPLTVAMLTVFLVLRAVYSILAGWIAGRLSGGLGRAPRAVTLLLLLTGIVAQLVNRGMYPLWYHIVFLASIVPCVTLGLRLGANSGTQLDTQSREA
ncbi:MAG: hypothetical protein KDA27_24750 [Candidatus Eisenbacteria bacterium]|uniref:Uncharacterized protein n=1 Tax=Eiseniibacteriota bacterium TaxID=2212470 RepID=A0A956NGM7_UNCEI|nr:hypothetical protein [Candidatus Eisenbacteria bacterium]